MLFCHAVRRAARAPHSRASPRVDLAGAWPYRLSMHTFHLCVLSPHPITSPQACTDPLHFLANHIRTLRLALILSTPAVAGRRVMGPPRAQAATVGTRAKRPPPILDFMPPGEGGTSSALARRERNSSRGSSPIDSLRLLKLPEKLDCFAIIG